ncbi:MAG TPA: sugar phosphate nucleotidyltransferase, partial [Solimonas sp.]|nr:sugar phosphate nucleotidyltransferase [Solimonas sp.]
MKSAIRILPVIMAGGSGNRLWPLSREQFPKQFLQLIDERSLLQNTALRAQGLPEALPPLLVCGEAHRFIVAEQLRQVEIAPSAILLEPEGRNSGPAAAVAAHWASEHHGPDTLLFLMAADHVIDDLALFAAALREAVPPAVAGQIVTFGVVPQRPETGYGYIQAGEPLAEGGRRIARFVEKPALELAQQYLADGGYFWNSGMFLFRADTLLQELSVFEPEMSHYAQLALLEA